MDLSKISANEKIELSLNGVEKRQTAIYTDKIGNFLQLPIYTSDDTQITGKIKLNLGKKSIKHLGVFVQIIGEAETYSSSDKPEAFLYRSQVLESPGKLKGEKIYNFLFMNFEAKSETYYGMGGKIRYYARVVISKKVGGPITKEAEFGVQLPLSTMVLNLGFDIQLRIADYLMITVELNRLNFHIDECLMGKITIERIKLMIKHVQVSIIKREIISPTGAAPSTKESVVTKIELTNKSPKTGDLIPFKINLSSLGLSPSMSLDNSKILVKYVMMLSFIDLEDRSLFKPIEINTWRKK